MIPKEKAKQLVDKLQDECVGMEIYWAKQCALLCVSEILKTIKLENNTNTERLNRMYWINVAEEIRNF